MLTKIYEESVEVEWVVVQQNSTDVAHELKPATCHDAPHVSPRLVADALCDVSYYEKGEGCKERRIRRDIRQVPEDADIEGAARNAELAICVGAEANWVEVFSRHDDRS